MTRRSLLFWGVHALVFVGVLGRRRRVLAQPTWSVAPARLADTSELVAVYNSHIAEGKCPYVERATLWTAERAEQFLADYDATLVIKRNGTPVGFAGLVDYTTEAGRRSILPGVAPEITVFAIAAARLESAEQLVAAKRLGAAVARRLGAMGFPECEMLIKADPIFSSDTWFRSHMAVDRVERKDGIDYALRVKFDLSPIASDLQAEGI